MAEHAGQAGLLGLHLVGVHRVEVSRRARVLDEVGACQLVGHLGRLVTLVHVVEEQLPLAHALTLSVP